jgi:hypothetical protein
MRLSALALSQPVFLAEIRAPDGFSTNGDVIGTAFWLSGEMFMTAGHVARNILSSDRHGVLLASPPEKGSPLGMRVSRAEVLDFDIGILQVPNAPKLSAGWIHAVKWRREPVVQFDRVWTMGYAFGTHRLHERFNTIQRAFSGHIVCDPPEYEVAQVSANLFAAYELSFGTPRGLSGSPLFSGDINSFGEVGVTGVIVGNAESKMLVYKSEERVTEGQTTIVEQYETLTLGIAVQSRSILPLRSEILSGSIGDFLKGADLAAA